MPAGQFRKRMHPLGADRRGFCHLIVRMVPAQVPDDFRIAFGDPGRHGQDILFRVIFARDQQRCQLDMARGGGGPDGLQDRIQLPAADLAVKARIPCFQVDVERVDPRQQFSQRLRIDRTVCDQNVFQAGSPDLAGTVQDILEVNEGLVIGVGDPDIAARLLLPGQGGQIFRFDLAPGRFLLRNRPVLAKRATEIATVRPA